MATKLDDLKVKLFTDGADKAQIVEMAKNSWIAGFTTNPSLLNNSQTNSTQISKALKLIRLCASTGTGRGDDMHCFADIAPLNKKMQAK